MPLSDKPNSSEPTPTGAQKVVRYSRQAALGMELPFTLVGTVVFGGFIGYLLDKWLHTSPWLMAILGAIGFVGGVREVIRRLSIEDKGNDSKPD
jgi:F0F1-type ATP synthase assembly protein I